MTIELVDTERNALIEKRALNELLGLEIVAE